MENTQTFGGYYADRATMRGPSAAALASQRPNAVETPGREYHSDAPIYGPTKKRSGGGLPTPKEFVCSPAGIVVLALAATYLGFRYVFA